MPEKSAIPSFIEIEMHNQNQKGVIMNTRMQTDAWIYRTIIVLGYVVTGSVVGILIITILHQSLPEILLALGSVALGGLVRL
jgi:hypothetical protein